jgi:glycerate kinase
MLSGQESRQRMRLILSNILQISSRLMHILVSPEKFKGSLSAQDAAAAIAEGWRAGSAASLDLEISCRPVADGGEGTAKVICEALGGSWVSCMVRILWADRSLRSTL